MPLLALWKADPAAIAALNVEQVVATAGDGRLADGSEASREFREYLAQASTDTLGRYAEHCLAESFQKSGAALQDVVNELGRRLDFRVRNGRYQGVVGGIGYDGVWENPDGGALVVEVKTTDAYRISLDTIAQYSRRLRDTAQLPEPSSVLIIVGRKDTGELEAQVRGSRHAWDMRLISIDSLLALVKLKESTETGDTGRKIRSILSPLEYTRLDALVDVLFTAAKDAEFTADSETVAARSPREIEEGSSGSSWEFTDPDLLNKQRLRILDALSRRETIAFVKRSRALYWDTSHSRRVVCTVSKRYADHSSTPYWYAYHPAWDKFLGEAAAGWFVLGCMDLDVAFALPLEVIRSQLDALNVTEKPSGDRYWHVKILESNPGVYELHLPRKGRQLKLSPFLLNLREQLGGAPR